jgi:ankyrin repeat protein
MDTLPSTLQLAIAFRPLRLLLDAGNEIDALERNCRTPLYNAAFRGHEAVTELLISRSANCHIADTESRLPLHDAAYFRSEKIVCLLLDKGSDPNA